MDGLICCCIAKVGGEPALRYTARGTPLVTFSASVQDSKAKEGETQAFWFTPTRVGTTPACNGHSPT